MPLSYSDPVVRISRRFSVAGCQRQPMTAHRERDRSALGGDDPSDTTRGEPRWSAGSFRLDLNHLRHRTRMFFPPLRRWENIRINSHNVSEHSPSGLEAPFAASPSRGCRYHERFPGQTSAERRPVPGSRWQAVRNL